MNFKNFDLRTDPWIAVSWLDSAMNTPDRIGLRELFTRAGEITDFHAPLAPAAAGLMRILTVLTAQITGLDTAGSRYEWEQRQAALVDDNRLGFDPIAVDSVLADDEAFCLFGKRPFLQDPRLVDECKSSTGVNKLGWTRVAGNNQVFLSHDRDVAALPIPADEAAWHLLAWLYYGASGRCTSRNVNGRNEANTGAGPLRRTLSIHPWGPNLYETLLVNQVYRRSPDNPDLAPWQQRELNHPLAAPPAPGGLAWLLTGRFRHAVLLVPDETGTQVVDTYITWAWREAHSDARDPHVPYQTNKKGESFPLYASADRDIWRDLDSLVLELPPDQQDNCPQVLASIRHSLSAEQLDRLRIRAFGYDQDGQTRDKAFFQASTPPVLGALQRKDMAGRIARAHGDGTSVGEALRTSLRMAWRNLVGDPKATPPWTDRAMATYWTEAGLRFWDFVESDDDGTVLPNAFIRIGVAVYEATTASYANHPKAIKCIEQQRTRLFQGWKHEAPHDDAGRDTAATDPPSRMESSAELDKGHDDFEW